MKHAPLIIGVVCILLFTGFSKYIKQGGFRGSDLAASVKIQERIDNSSRLRLAHAVGEVMEGSTFFASPGITVVVVLAFTAWAGIDVKKKRVRMGAILIPVMLTLLVGAEIYGKSVVHHPAPPFYMIKNPTSIFPKYYINDEFSYPSGHAARAVFMATIFYSLFTIHYSLGDRKKKLFVIAGLLGYVFLVGISRIYLGHHWLSDILGGGMLGLGCALLGIAFLLPAKKAADHR